jgi:hypothetical protein
LHNIGAAPVHIFESESTETSVIAQVLPNATVVAAKVPVERSGRIMVLIRPRGAVNISTFKMMLTEGGDQFEASILEHGGAIGFSSSAPPGRVFVESVKACSWSENTGIAKGDEIVALNGQLVRCMHKKHFLDMLETRPLHLSIRPLFAPAERRESERAKHLQTSTILVCVCDDSAQAATIFESEHSSLSIGSVFRGDRVVVSGPAVESEGVVMVPIKPRGAVDLNDFVEGRGEDWPSVSDFS